jgi:hypothetical protein
LNQRSNSFSSSPVFYRAFFFALATVCAPVAWGQAGYRPAPSYIATGKPDQAEGARVLHEFQNAGISGTYWLDFELQVLPHRGEEKTVAGELIGTRSEQGPLTRLKIDTDSWLIQSGPQASAWHSHSGAKPEPVTVGQTLDSLAGTDLTIFELQMPFFYWTDFMYEGLDRIRGRPAHRFVLYPPKDLAAARPDLTGVRVYLDTQFQALVQAELLGPKGTVDKIITILDLKKVGERYIPKSIDFRNNVTHGKTRFNVRAAALDLALPEETFDPNKLDQPAPQIPAGKIQPL